MLLSQVLQLTIQTISVGQVLDAHGRSYFGMSQLMKLVQMMRNGEVTAQDAVFI